MKNEFSKMKKTWCLAGCILTNNSDWNKTIEYLGRPDLKSFQNFTLKEVNCGIK